MRKIILKTNSTSSYKPKTTELDLGELAINTADGVLFTKKNDGTVVAIGSGGSGGGHEDPGEFTGEDYTPPDDVALATVATTGSYFDLLDAPVLFDGDYDALHNKPVLFDGNYASLTNKPTIPTNNNELTNGSNYITQTQARTSISTSGSLSYDSLTGVISYTQPTLATVATTGNYQDLTNKPVIGDALPSQTGHAGKVLSTDGTNASWQEASGGGGSSTQMFYLMNYI